MDFMPSLPVLAAFTVAAAILIITPGPDMTLCLSRALTQGRAAGFATMLGAATGNLIHTVLAAIGLSALLAASPTAFLVVKILGALYLLYLAYEAVRHGSALTLKPSDGPRHSFLADWLTGLGINLINPKVVLFFVTFLPQFVAASDPDAGAKLAFLGVYFVALAVPSIALMVLAADRFAGALKRNRRVARAIDYACATIFAGFAIRMVAARG